MQKITPNAALPGLTAVPHPAAREDAPDTYHKIELKWENPILSAEAYGNKAANLSILSFLFKDAKGVEIPSFMGISHAEMQRHLAAHYPDYQRDWAEFLELKGTGPGMNGKAEFQLRLIQEKIEAAFTDHPFTSDMLNDFTEYSESNMHLLMVRSTGDEDSSELANAGGNHSEIGVYPQRQRISEGMGKVVASYHSPLSITQREQAGQDVTKAPKVSVLLQVMVGEAEDGPIPVSGIAYSREILGKTEGLTQIQSLYGHGEAAVNSLLPVDTFYVYPDGNCHQIIRYKENRLVPGWASALTTAENPKHLKAASSLTKTQVELIERSSRRIHEHYGKPMDIEWIYDTGRDILYLVQARPVVEKYPMDPETLNLEAFGQAVSRHESETIVSVQGKVQLITQLSQLIVERSLGSAFLRLSHLARENAHHDIKAIIVREPAVATSHYACIFREMGIDLFVCPTFDSRSLEMPEGFVALDEQKELVLTGQNFPRGAVQKGWFRHPIAARESLQPIAPMSGPEIERLRRRLLPDGPSKVTMDATKLRMLLDQLGSPRVEEVEAAARELTVWIAIKLRSLPSHAESVGLLRNVVALIEPLLFSTEMPRMHRLHAAKRLQALIFQQRAAHIIHSNSLLQLLAEKRAYDQVAVPTENLLSPEEQETLRAAESASDPMDEDEVKNALALYEMAKGRCFTQSTQDTWAALSLKIASSRSRLVNRLLIKLIDTLKDHEVLDEWLNFTIPELSEDSGNVVTTLMAAATKVSRSSPEFARLSALRNEVDQWEARIEEWSDPDNFTLLMGRFKPFTRSMIEHMGSFTEIPSEDLLLKSGAMALYKRFVELYDLSIKSMRGSPHFPDKSVQAQAFKEMLFDYIAIAIIWTQRIPDSTIEVWTAALHCQRKIPDPRDFHISMTRQYEQISDPDEQQLRPSAHFNVAARVINTGQLGSTESLEGCTLEDLFMLAHQNTHAAFDAVFRTPWERGLPESLNRIHGLVETTINVETRHFQRRIPVKATLLSCTHSAKTITLSYTIPIKFHGALLTITYDRKSEKMTLDFRILGHNLGNRMAGVIRNLIFRELIYDFHTLHKPSYDEGKKELQARWELTERNVPFLLQTLMEAAVETLRGLLGESKISFERIDQGNSRFWEVLFATPEKLDRWLLAGAPYHGLVLHVLRYNGHEDLLKKLFGFLGIEVMDSEAPFSIRLLQATTLALRAWPLPLAQHEAAATLLYDYLRYTCLNPRQLGDHPELVQWLHDVRRIVVCPEKCTLSTKYLVARLQLLILHQIITSPESTEADVQTYLEYLAERNQSLATYLITLQAKEIIGEYKGFEEKMGCARNYITRRAQEVLEPGYAPKPAESILEDQLDIRTLKVGDRVLCQGLTERWRIGSVTGRDDHGAPQVDIGERNLITITEEAILYPARLRSEG